MDVNLSLGNASLVNATTPYVSFEVFLIIMFISIALLIVSHYRVDILMSALGVVFSVGGVWGSLGVATVGYATAMSGTVLSVVPVVTMMNSPALTVMCIVLLIISIINLIYIISEMSYEATKNVAKTNPVVNNKMGRKKS